MFSCSNSYCVLRFSDQVATMPVFIQSHRRQGLVVRGGVDERCTASDRARTLVCAWAGFLCAPNSPRSTVPKPNRLVKFSAVTSLPLLLEMPMPSQTIRPDVASLVPADIYIPSSHSLSPASRRSSGSGQSTVTTTANTRPRYVSPFFFSKLSPLCRTPYLLHDLKTSDLDRKRERESSHQASGFWISISDENRQLWSWGVRFQLNTSRSLFLVIYLSCSSVETVFFPHIWWPGHLLHQ